MLEAALTAWSRPEQQPAQPSASPANDGDADGARPADPAPSAEPPCGYVLVSCVQLVGIVLMVWARRELAPHVADVRAISIGTGALGFLGNKGAAAIRLSLYHSYARAAVGRQRGLVAGRGVVGDAAAAQTDV
jgi:hypothetical protein